MTTAPMRRSVKAREARKTLGTIFSGGWNKMDKITKAFEVRVKKINGETVNSITTFKSK